MFCRVGAGFALFIRNAIVVGQVVQRHVLCKTFAGTASLYSFLLIFQVDSARFVFLCAGGSPSVLEQALRCFSQRHCRLAGWAKACFRQKFAGAAWFSLLAVFSVEKCVAIGFC